MPGNRGAELGELLGDALGRGASASVAGGHRALDGEHVAYGGSEARVDLRELRVGEVVELDPELLAPAYARTGQLVFEHKSSGAAAREIAAFAAETERLAP